MSNESYCVAVYKPLAAAGVLAMAGVLSAASAQATDLGPGSLKDFPTELPAPRCAIFHGFYIGGHVGGAIHNWNWQDRDAWANDLEDELHVGSLSGTDTGVVGGVQGGFNWQRGCTVLGLEADWSWANLDSTKVNTDGDTGINTDFLRVRSQLDGFGTLRTRAGVVVDNLLLYVTGGLAFADINRRWELEDLNPPAREAFSSSDTRLGVAAGLGAEWAINDFISIKSEALWLRFEDDSVTRFATVFANPDRNVRFDNQDDVLTARVGLNFRFGGP
jgi:outer membrane immunogenic protein